MEKNNTDVERLTKTLRCNQLPPFCADVLGSYTGLDEDGSAPVQDADDL